MGYKYGEACCHEEEVYSHQNDKRRHFLMPEFLMLGFM